MYSTSWKASRSRWSLATSPTNSTIGVESWNAVCTPIEALVAPGPRVTKHTPGRPGQLAVRLGHEGGPAFLAIDDEADLVAVRVKAVEHGEVAFARHAERVGRALGHQAFDEEMTRDLGVGDCAHKLDSINVLVNYQAWQEHPPWPPTSGCATQTDRKPPS